MLKKVLFCLQSFLITYFSAFLLVAPVWADNYNLQQYGATIYQRNNNNDLLYALEHRMANGKGATMTNTVHIQMDSPPIVVAKYAPMLMQGRIAVIWIHDFLTKKNFEKWSNLMKQQHKWGSIWRAEYTGYGAKYVLFHEITPQELFAPVKTAGGTVLDNGHLLGDDVDYNKIINCSGGLCMPTAFKGGEKLFFSCVSAVAKKYFADTGYIVVQNVSTHTVVHKDKGLFKTKITVYYYLDSYPSYYILTLPNAPGVINSPSSGFQIGGMGYLRVDPKTAEGWDFSSGSILYAKDSKSGWNGWVGIVIGGLTGIGLSLLGMPGLSVFLNPGFLYGGYATTQVIRVGNAGTFHGLFNYYKLDYSGKAYDAARADLYYWLKTGWGNEFDGTKYTVSPSYIMSQQKQIGTWKNVRPISKQELQQIQGN